MAEANDQGISSGLYRATYFSRLLWSLQINWSLA